MRFAVVTRVKNQLDGLLSFPLSNRNVDQKMHDDRRKVGTNANGPVTAREGDRLLKAVFSSLFLRIFFLKNVTNCDLAIYIVCLSIYELQKYFSITFGQSNS